MKTSKVILQAQICVYIYNQRATFYKRYQLPYTWPIFMVIRSSAARLHLLIAFQELLLQLELFTI